VAALSPVMATSQLAELPHRELMRVEFTTSADLRKAAKYGGKIVFLHSYFCDREDDHVGLGGPGVYVEMKDASAEQSVSNDRYIFFLDVSREAQPMSIPPKQGFDLSVASEDICFYVTIHGALITSYTSPVARIPKAAIHQAFAAKHE
jgi:hypothetical protein